MGWVISDGHGEEAGDYKLWSPIYEAGDASEATATELLVDFLSWLDSRGLGDGVAFAKVSIDDPVVLVVYLADGMDLSDPIIDPVVSLMKEFGGSSVVKAGYSDIAGSPVLAVR